MTSSGGAEIEDDTDRCCRFRITLRSFIIVVVTTCVVVGSALNLHWQGHYAAKQHRSLLATEAQAFAVTARRKMERLLNVQQSTSMVLAGRGAAGRLQQQMADLERRYSIAADLADNMTALEGMRQSLAVDATFESWLRFLTPSSVESREMPMLYKSAYTIFVPNLDVAVGYAVIRQHVPPLKMVTIMSSSAITGQWTDFSTHIGPSGTLLNAARVPFRQFTIAEDILVDEFRAFEASRGSTTNGQPQPQYFFGPASAADAPMSASPRTGPRWGGPFAHPYSHGESYANFYYPVVDEAEKLMFVITCGLTSNVTQQWLQHSLEEFTKMNDLSIKFVVVFNGYVFATSELWNLTYAQPASYTPVDQFECYKGYCLRPVESLGAELGLDVSRDTDGTLKFADPNVARVFNSPSESTDSHATASMAIASSALNQTIALPSTSGMRLVLIVRRGSSNCGAYGCEDKALSFAIALIVVEVVLAISCTWLILHFSMQGLLEVLRLLHHLKRSGLRSTYVVEPQSRIREVLQLQVVMRDLQQRLQEVLPFLPAYVKVTLKPRGEGASGESAAVTTLKSAVRDITAETSASSMWRSRSAAGRGVQQQSDSTGSMNAWRRPVAGNRSLGAQIAVLGEETGSYDGDDSFASEVELDDTVGFDMVVTSAFSGQVLTLPPQSHVVSDTSNSGPSLRGAAVLTASRARNSSSDAAGGAIGSTSGSGSGPGGSGVNNNNNNNNNSRHAALINDAGSDPSTLHYVARATMMTVLIDTEASEYSTARALEIIRIVVPIVKRHRGSIDSLRIITGIVASFNFVKPCAMHEEEATLCALEVIQTLRAARSTEMLQLVWIGLDTSIGQAVITGCETSRRVVFLSTAVEVSRRLATHGMSMRAKIVSSNRCAELSRCRFITLDNLQLMDDFIRYRRSDSTPRFPGQLNGGAPVPVSAVRAGIDTTSSGSADRRVTPIGSGSGDGLASNPLSRAAASSPTAGVTALTTTSAASIAGRQGGSRHQVAPQTQRVQPFSSAISSAAGGGGGGGVGGHGGATELRVIACEVLPGMQRDSFSPESRPWYTEALHAMGRAAYRDALQQWANARTDLKRGPASRTGGVEADDDARAALVLRVEQLFEACRRAVATSELHGYFRAEHLPWVTAARVERTRTSYFPALSHGHRGTHAGTSSGMNDGSTSGLRLVTALSAASGAVQLSGGAYRINVGAQSSQRAVPWGSVDRAAPVAMVPDAFVSLDPLQPDRSAPAATLPNPLADGANDVVELSDNEVGSNGALVEVLAATSGPLHNQVNSGNEHHDSAANARSNHGIENGSGVLNYSLASVGSGAPVVGLVQSAVPAGRGDGSSGTEASSNRLTPLRGSEGSSGRALGMISASNFASASFGDRGTDPPLYGGASFEDTIGSVSLEHR